MDAFSAPEIEIVTVMTSAQVGKTEIINNVVGFFMSHDPCPILVIQPTLEMGMAWSKDRLGPMVRDTPCLVGRVKEARARDSQNTILHKTFPGGHITIAGANSPASLASRPVRIVLFDEVDRFPASVGMGERSEGDPVKLGMKRTKNFFNRKILLTSTPTVMGVSRIEASWMQSDQRHCMLPCPKCGTLQKLLFSRTSQFAGISGGQLVFDKENCSWAYYECEKCKAQLGEPEKHAMLRGGEWYVMKPAVTAHAGFHLNELYSPWSTWLTVAREFLEAKQRRETLQVFINTTIGETWQEAEAYTINDETLLSRVENYTVVPAEVLLLTVGVDTQDDRLELVIKGWGPDNQSWLIGYRVLYGTPSDLSVWKALDDILLANYKTDAGATLKIECVCIDSAGHFTQEVYKYVRLCMPRRVFAIVGRDGARPFIGKMTRNNRERARLIPIGVDDAKSTIYRRLQVETPGPGYMHFNQDATESYFHGLTAERQVIKRVNGFPRKVWELKSQSARNEPLDCEVYAMAACAILNPNWEALRKRLDSQIANAPEQPEETVEVERPAPRPVFRRRKSFATNF